MTTLAALLGALPLVIASGPGSELRRPLGITIVGGLIVSQALTLYTTPVIYLLLDRLHRRTLGHQSRAPRARRPAAQHRARAAVVIGPDSATRFPPPLRGREPTELAALLLAVSAGL